MGRRLSVSTRDAATTVGLAALPDILQALPILAWWGFDGGTFVAVLADTSAIPGQEPILAPAVVLVSHHLHCLAHTTSRSADRVVACHGRETPPGSANSAGSEGSGGSRRP
jgi:hypothetical protein